MYNLHNSYFVHCVIFAIWGLVYFHFHIYYTCTSLRRARPLHVYVPYTYTGHNHLLDSSQSKKPASGGGDLSQSLSQVRWWELHAARASRIGGLVQRFAKSLWEKAFGESFAKGFASPHSTVVHKPLPKCVANI